MAESLHDGEGTQAIPQRETENREDGQASFGPESTVEGSKDTAGDGKTPGPTVEASGEHPTPTARLEPSGEAIEQELESLSRAPFRRILKDFLGFTPTPEALKRFADKYPDKWAKSIGVIAQLAGYQTDVVETNNILIIGHMDDSALRKRMAELEQKLNLSHNTISTKIENTPSRHFKESDPSSSNIIDVEATVKAESKKAGEN